MQIIYWLTNFLCHRQVVMATGDDCTDTREREKKARRPARCSSPDCLGRDWRDPGWQLGLLLVGHSAKLMKVAGAKQRRIHANSAPAFRRLYTFTLVHLIAAWQLSIRNSNIMGGLDERHAPSELQWADYWLQTTETMRSLVRVKLDNLRNRTRDY